MAESASKDETEEICHGRPKFRRVTKKTKAHRIRRREDDDDDGTQPDSSSPSAMEAIEETRKKRKLLNQVLYKRGLDATAKPKVPSSRTSTSAATIQPSKEQHKDLTGQLKGTFSGGTGGDAVDGEDGVLQRKHKDAMEEFIRQNLTSQQQQQQSEETTATTVNDLKNKLYQELATASLQLAGAKPTEQENEGDVGAGGAMLGGTGIAEVALPVDDKIKVIRATEQAVSSMRPSHGRRDPTFTSGVQTEAGRGFASVSSSADFGQEFQQQDMSNVPVSVGRNFQLQSQEWVHRRREAEEPSKGTKLMGVQQQQPQEVDNVPANGERMGFEASRRAAASSGGTSSFETSSRKGPDHRSSDDRVWKRFIKVQNESRDRHARGR